MELEHALPPLHLSNGHIHQAPQLPHALMSWLPLLIFRRGQANSLKNFEYGKTVGRLLPLPFTLSVCKELLQRHLGEP